MNCNQNQAAVVSLIEEVWSAGNLDVADEWRAPGSR